MTLLHCYVRTIGVIVMGACNRVLLVVGGTIGGDNNMVGFVLLMVDGLTIDWTEGCFGGFKLNSTPRFGGKGNSSGKLLAGNTICCGGKRIVVSFYVGFQFNVEGSEREKAKRKRVDISSSTNQRCTYSRGGISTVRTHLKSTQQILHTTSAPLASSSITS